jgi:hypothetical protein
LFEGSEIDWVQMGLHLLNNSGRVGLRDVWGWFRQVPYLGTFHSYEIVTDLRHTDLLKDAPDIMTWANPGPGAIRGLNVLYGRDWDTKVSREQSLEEMREILSLSQDTKNWPNNQDYPPFELRDVEHNLCEIAKKHRGTTRSIYRPPVQRVIL